MYLNKNILMMLMITLRTLFKTTKDKKNVGVKEKELPVSCHWVDSLEIALNIRFH